MSKAIVDEFKLRFAYINKSDINRFVGANGDPYEPSWAEASEFLKNGSVKSKGSYCEEKACLGSKLVKITKVIYLFEEVNNENEIPMS